MPINLNDLKGVCSREIDRAGARYTPHVEEGAPNLQVKKVLDATDTLSFNDRANENLKDLSDDLKEIWGDSPAIAKSLFKNRKQTPLYIAEVLDSLIDKNPGDASNELQKLSRSVNFVAKELRIKRRELLEYERKKDSSDEGSSVQYDRIQIDKILDVVSRVENYSKTAVPNLFKNNRALLIGEWGTGKTHTLADITQKRIDNEKPTLFVLAHHLSSNTDPIAQICEDFGLDCNKKELLDFLQSSAEETDQRALLIFDGINEGDREAWSEAIGDIANEIESYSHIGLILSCRTPYDKYLFTARERNLFEVIRHPGFEENEINAQEKFFNYYDIPSPQVPLLNPEFSRPLFLKLFCKAIEKRSRGTQRRKIRELANGQKGMKYLFEYFTKNVGEPIEDEFKLTYKTCWKIIKGVFVDDQGLQGLAVTMAEKGRRFVTHEKVIEIVMNITSIDSQDVANELIHRMANQGLLLEDLVYDNGEYIEVIKLPYQRFSDHVIARHLLYTGDYLNKDTKETIKRSFYKDRPLGKIFTTDRYGDSFSDPGLASALILEFPEAVKNVLPENERELIAFIPKRRRFFNPIAESFLDGLIWRSTETFSEQTGKLIQILLEQSNDHYLYEVFEVLVTLASRPGHPCNASSLLNYLQDQDISERDLRWSEYLRQAGKGSTVVRLLSWVELIDTNKLDKESADNLIVLLSLMLTTTHRERRDRVTRALYFIGYEHPPKLFKQTIQSLSFNDPYRPERMLASAYGVAMNCWADTTKKEFRESIGAFAKSIYEMFFAPGADHATYHELMKGYAKGIIELARKIEPHCIANQYVKYTRPPFEHFPNPFPEANEINEDDVEDADEAIHMDFGNYTIGRLIKDRGNYDYENPDYKVVRRQIKWRIMDLGYNSSDFKEVDNFLDRRNFNSGRSNNGSKINRYGKKYSWIAYFEMHGLRKDLGLLPEDRIEHRSSDCDIDPSFPIEENNWNPDLPDIFAENPEDKVEWMSCEAVPDYQSIHQIDKINDLDGPWVLLDGFVEQGCSDGRRIFTFLRGLFISPDLVDKLKSRVNKVLYPGNFKIPDPNCDYYTFNGEIPWSCRYGRFLRKSNCVAKRDLREVLSEREVKTVEKHKDDLNSDELLHLKTLKQFQGMPGLGREDQELIDENGMVTLTKTREISGIRAEIPIYEFGWESYHSEMNQVGNIDFPAPALCEELELVNIGQSIDLYDQSARKSSIYRSSKKGEEHDFHFLYLRKDLLEKYLSNTDQTLVWLDWGERTLHYEDLNAAGHGSEIQEVRNNYLNIHKTLLQYDKINS